MAAIVKTALVHAFAHFGEEMAQLFFFYVDNTQFADAGGINNIPPCGSSNISAKVVVCMPLSLHSDTMCVRRSRSGSKRLIRLDLPTPEWPGEKRHLIFQQIPVLHQY
jgi:hypothetical protein